MIKVCSYIPGVTSLQKSVFEQGELEKDAKNDGSPNGPQHDVQVEQFLSKQYHSMSGEGMPIVRERGRGCW